eukprot:2778208-Pyramimonas_sp.AAC.1
MSCVAAPGHEMSQPTRTLQIPNAKRFTSYCLNFNSCPHCQSPSSKHLVGRSDRVARVGGQSPSGVGAQSPSHPPSVFSRPVCPPIGHDLCCRKVENSALVFYAILRI